MFQLSRYFKDRAIFWMAVSTSLIVIGVFFEELPYVQLDEVQLYLWTRIPITLGIVAACIGMALQPSRLSWQYAYVIVGYLYTLQGEYFRPNYIFSYMNYMTIQALFLRISARAFLILHGIGTLFFAYWMYFNFQKNIDRMVKGDLFVDYVSLVIIAFIIGYLVFIQINKARQEKDQSQSRFLLIGKQAVNIIHDLKSLASAPQIYIDMLMQMENGINPETENILRRLNEDLSNMVKKTKDLYGMVQLKSVNRKMESAQKSLERTLSLLGHRMSQVRIEIQGSADHELPEGHLELIFLNLFYNSLNAWAKTSGEEAPYLKIDFLKDRIFVEDNAGGAPAAVIDNFNSRQTDKNTGLGLFLINDAAQSVGWNVVYKNIQPLGRRQGLRVEIILF